MLSALVTKNSNSHQQTLSVTSVYAAMPFGGAVASLMSLLLSASLWRVIFIASGMIPLLLVPWMAWGLPESSAFERSRVAASTCLRAGSFSAVFTNGRALTTVLLWLSPVRIIVAVSPFKLVTVGFVSRIRPTAFSWRSSATAVQRIKEAVKEITAVAKSDGALAAEGAVRLIERLSPALEQVDSSSGVLGNAVNRALDCLIPILTAAEVPDAVRDRWLERLLMPTRLTRSPISKPSQTNGEPYV